MHALMRDRKFIHAVAMLVGIMAGVGVYGIPFAFAKAGFLVGVGWLVLLTGLVALFDLLLAELVLSTEGTHQLIGYANIWLGPWGRRAMALAYILSIYGALLAYLIVFGEFAHNILSQFFAVDPQLYSFVFAAGWSLLWLVRLRTAAAVELVMVVLYGVIVLVLFVMGVPKIHLANLAGWEPHFWYLPYGILLFALTGMSAIPLQRQLLVGRERLMRPAILTAMAVIAIIYLLFAFTVVGVSGEVTSPEAIAGLFDFLGTPVIILGSLLGMMTVATSYLVLGTALFESFHLDYRLKPFPSWLLAAVPPILFFWSGLRNFIDVIGLAGAVAIGFQVVVLLGAYLKSRRMRLRASELHIRIPVWAVMILMAVFCAGVLHELFLRWSI